MNRIDLRTRMWTALASEFGHAIMDVVIVAGAVLVIAWLVGPMWFA